MTDPHDASWRSPVLQSVITMVFPGGYPGLHSVATQLKLVGLFAVGDNGMEQDRIWQLNQMK